MPRTDTIQISDLLKRYAREIGLSGLAVGTARPLTDASQRLQERINKGFAGHYGLVDGSQKKFCHPETLLPDAKSIICCALSYLLPDENSTPPPGCIKGHTARFARGQDYHDVIGDKLRKMAEYLQQIVPGAQTRILHDTGPLLDRAAAEASGLGWFGKNACIIIPDYGSWVVLGEIITDVELPPDKPFADHKCGSCELCLSACPTGAIESPFEINLNKCISHLTQMSRIIPRHLRPLMGVMVYGCDICQEVCPQNSDVKPGDPSDFEPGPLPAYPDLLWLLNMSKAEFNSTLAKSSAGWIGRNRLRRNACIALGNLKATPALPDLIRAVHDPSVIVRAHAVWDLGQIGDQTGFDILQKRLKHESDPDVLQEIRESLAGIPNKSGEE